MAAEYSGVIKCVPILLDSGDGDIGVLPFHQQVVGKRPLLLCLRDLGKMLGHFIDGHKSFAICIKELKCFHISEPLSLAINNRLLIDPDW